MHDIEFAKAWAAETVKILNLPMATYTIGCELALLKRANPLVLYSSSAIKELPAEAKGHALAEAVQLCYNEKDESAQKLIENTKKWIAGAAELELDDEIKLFQAYREDGSRDLPMAKMPRTQGVPYHYFGGPELARLINYVVEKHTILIHTHFSGSPLNFPLGLARMFYLVQLESDGAVWIKNWHDMENDARKEKFDQENPESTLAMGWEAVQAQAEKWNAEHPDAQVPLPENPKGTS